VTDARRAPKACPTCKSPNLEMYDQGVRGNLGYVRCNCGYLHYIDATKLIPPGKRWVHPQEAQRRKNIEAKRAKGDCR
jgi:hypothetical protein